MIKPNMPNAEYHAMIDHVSNSMLNTIGKSPLAFKHWLNSEKKPTDAMILGSATHTLVLEPEKFDDEFIVAPIINKRTNAGKAEFAEFIEAAGDKTVLTTEQHIKAANIAYSVYNHPQAKKLLDKPGRSELSFFNVDEETDTPIKWRVDRLTDDGWLIDLKTTKCAEPKEFAKSVVNFNYHSQAAYYIDNTRNEGIEIKGFIFIVVENTAPFSCAVYYLDDEAIELGRETYRRRLNLYSKCCRADVWPSFGYDFEKNKYEIQELSLPGWAYK